MFGSFDTALGSYYKHSGGYNFAGITVRFPNKKNARNKRAKRLLKLAKQSRKRNGGQTRTQRHK